MDPSCPSPGVKVTEQVAVPPLPERVHWPFDGLNDPDPDGALKVKVPVGVTLVPPDVSLTVAVHVVGELTATGEEHDMEVEVDLPPPLDTVRTVEPELTVWSVSP